MRLFGRLKKEHWNELLGVLLVIFAIWMLVSLIGYGGGMGDRLRDGLTHWIGYISYLLTLIIGYWGIGFFVSAKRGILSGFLGSICLLVSGLMLLGLFTSVREGVNPSPTTQEGMDTSVREGITPSPTTQEGMDTSVREGVNPSPTTQEGMDTSVREGVNPSPTIVGVLGEQLDSLCAKWIGVPGLFLAGLVFLILGVTLSSELTFSALFRPVYAGFRRLFAGLFAGRGARAQDKRKRKAGRRKREAGEGLGEELSVSSEPAVIISDDFGKEAADGVYLRQPSAGSRYIVPPLSLLDRTASADQELTKEMLQETARILERSFEDFNIDASVLRVNRGPVITRYEVEPGPGVKVSKFVSLSDDLALMLRATRVRVVAPVPGEGVIGIEVPNERVAEVGLREVLESQEFRNTKSKLALPLGKDISGKPFMADLAEMPHLLIAGTTGSGKSVFLNSVIASMLFRMTPDELRLLMIDPKRVELNAYNGIPHLMAPVVTDSMRAPAYLKWALREVEKRYKKLANIGVRNVESYNRYMAEHADVVGTTMEEDHLVHGRLPYILIIIDELADLMLVASSEVEASITRLAQIARAAGVHMLVSTQRPSVNVITGSIKANLPCRLSFRVVSKVDSRTILDMNGAENLLGRGDMLFLGMNAAKPIRIQGCYVSEVEIERLVDFVKQHAPVSEAEMSDIEAEESAETEQDELYGEAVRLVLKHRTASTSFLQRKLNVSYDRAVQLLEDMEAEGVVGPVMGDRPREILIDGQSD